MNFFITETISHVLGKFSTEETEILNNVLKEVMVGFDLIQRYGIEKGSNHMNSYQPENFLQKS